MIKSLQEYRESHYMNTGKVSDNVRMLSISAIGIIWIFKVQNGDGGYQIPEPLYLPVLWVFIAMALDFAQYLYGSIAWFLFFRGKEKEIQKRRDQLKAENKEVTKEDREKSEKEILAPEEINYPSYTLFFGKVIAIGCAYYYLITFLAHAVKWHN